MRVLLLCIAFYSLVVVASTPVRVASPQSELEASTSYYVDLLRVLLEKTSRDFGPAHLMLQPSPASGSLWKLMLDNNQIDVHWLTPTAEIEQHLLVVPVPAIYGGLGLRGLMIKSTQLAQFRQIRSLADLALFTACQGEYWPDVQVLQHAGLKVHKVQHFESMLDMLHKGRCDYFPRSVIEGPVESTAQPWHYKGLSFFTEVLLYYPLPVYFYVNPTDTVLASRLEQGLLSMNNSGELLAFMQQHPVTRHLFKPGLYKDSLLFRLDNPALPIRHQQEQPDFWFQLLRN